jgi:hypothetical protein
MCYSHNSYFNNPEQLGDRLADYVDNMGGVVITGYTCCGCSLAGRWRYGGYDPLIPQQSTSAVGMRLGKLSAK